MSRHDPPTTSYCRTLTRTEVVRLLRSLTLSRRHIRSPSGVCRDSYTLKEETRRQLRRPKSLTLGSCDEVYLGHDSERPLDLNRQEGRTGDPRH